MSLAEPLSQIASRFEASREAAGKGVRVRLSLGASSLVAEQIRAGAPIDVFVSADARIVDELEAEGRVAPGGRIELARNRLVVLTRSSTARTPAGPEELLDASIRRLAVPDGAVPVGRYAREWLARRGLLARLEPRIVRTEHARATLVAVDLGHADVAIVYATDARLARNARVAFEIPDTEQPRILYAAARVGEGEEALRFVAFLEGPEARSVLRAAGFGAP